MRRNDPVLHTVALGELRPTQLTIGAHEVAQRRAAWEHARGKARAALLAGHVVPGVIGPKGRFYIVDHHHLARALLEAGAHGVFVQALADLSRLSKDDFWMTMDLHGWVHTYDARGRRTTFEAIPKRLADLADDPYRSVAGAVRRAGGFAKDTTPFAEFLWAQFFRSRIDARALMRDFDAMITKALRLAAAKEADHLPGWCGPRAQAKESATPTLRTHGRRQ
jgi:hypothetical protein